MLKHISGGHPLATSSCQLTSAKYFAEKQMAVWLGEEKSQHFVAHYCLPLEELNIKTILQASVRPVSIYLLIKTNIGHILYR